MPARRCGACGAGGHRTGCGARPGGRADDLGGPCGPGPRDRAGRTAARRGLGRSCRGPGGSWPGPDGSWPGSALGLPGPCRAGGRPAGAGRSWSGRWPLQAGLAGAAGPSPGPGGPSPEPTGSAWPWRSWPGRSGPCRAVGPARLWPGGRVLALRTRGPSTLPGPDGSGRGPRRVPVAGASRPTGASDPSVGRSCAARSGGPGPYREAGPRLVREPWPVPDATREAGAVRPVPPAPPGRSPRAGPRAAGRTRAGPT